MSNSAKELHRQFQISKKYSSIYTKSSMIWTILFSTKELYRQFQSMKKSHSVCAKELVPFPQKKLYDMESNIAMQTHMFKCSSLCVAGCVAVCCSVLQRVYIYILGREGVRVGVCCSVCCSMLQRVCIDRYLREKRHELQCALQYVLQCVVACVCMYTWKRGGVAVC